MSPLISSTISSAPLAISSPTSSTKPPVPLLLESVPVPAPAPAAPPPVLLAPPPVPDEPPAFEPLSELSEPPEPYKQQQLMLISKIFFCFFCP